MSRALTPIVKWVGGKRQLLPQIRPLIPADYSQYGELFVGGGAVLFDLLPANAIVNDLNTGLIETYEVIRDSLEDLLTELKKFENTRECYYRVREQDRDLLVFSQLTKVQRAARLIFLNKTCFNGLYRVNQAGEFNTPFGAYKNPNIVNEDTLRAVNAYFNDAAITFTSKDFLEAGKTLMEGAFVYLDPPYDPIAPTSNFTGYQSGGFTREDQKKLKTLCDSLTERGIKFLLSNSATPFIKDLYANYTITVVNARRNVNSNGSKRGAVEEVLVRNYE